ncbi:MAG: hypothetical protein QOK05_2675 [Chloroflexota bacterium]|nr:hypothetical protein [Chloroflexota bacterium]
MPGETAPARRRLLDRDDGDAAPRPADECPYERPFQEGFDDCPAYAARRFVPFDSLHRPLNAIWTCNFLTPKRAVDKAHGYYACCSLGDVAARLAWVERVHKDRLDSVVRLQRATESLAQPFIVEIYAAKARQLEGGEAGAQATNELERLLHTLETEIVAYFDDHAAEFEAASLPVDACKEIMTLAVRDMVERRGSARRQFTPPQALVERFPSEIRPLLFPATTET